MTYLEAWKRAASALSVSGPRRCRVDLPSGGYVVASLYDGEDEARDPLGRDMLRRIDAGYARERMMTEKPPRCQPVTHKPA